MKNHRCVIVDDENLARELLQSHLKQLDNFELIASCSSAIEASNILQSEDVDLLFLDIEMPVLKGTDFYRGLSHKPKVIFTTAYRDYALDGFELDAVDYLLKPIVFSRFFKAIEKYSAAAQNKKKCSEEQDGTLSRGTRDQKTHIFIKIERKQVKVFLSDILFIEGLKDYIKIHTRHGCHITKQRLSIIEELLDDHFIRTHRSYIVNEEHISAYSKHDIEINDIEIPIGNNYKQEVFKRLKM